jgi:hypothetical protein
LRKLELEDGTKSEEERLLTFGAQNNKKKQRITFVKRDELEIAEIKRKDNAKKLKS